MTLNIRLQLFGILQIEVNGKSAEFKRRKSEALVAYLALHEGVHAREKIANLFWGNSSDEDARRTLRVVLTDVRKTLGENALLGDRDTLALNPDILPHVDAHQFKTLLRDPATATTPELLSALELYRGDLLEGSYEDWAVSLRETYRVSFLSVLGVLAERARNEGEYSRAVGFAERMLQIDPFNETALQHLIVSLAANGDKEYALQRFKDFEKQEGIEFSKETLALRKQIYEQAVSTSARLTNLPRPPTSFIGREDELNEVETLLTQYHLVTLLGAGGSGKTRLAIQAADEIAHDYSGGVWWVDLSPLTEPDLVPQSIANTLGVKEKPNQNVLQLVAERIGEQHILIVLDNCEHLLSACSQSVEFLLAVCPQLIVLATSREPLGVEGEAEWQVPTFPLPEADLNLKILKKNESVRLFLERGRSANNSFQLTEANAPHVVNICRKLDGIPLALELTAALLRSLSVDEVAQRLDQRFEMLHITDSARLPRQQTLRALIDWSYNLLTTTEQIFFRRLGVFAGGWTFDAAVVIGGGYEMEDAQKNFISEGSSPALPINPADIVLSLLDSLRRRSLVQVSYMGNPSRYSMLETLREYAVERLAEEDELDELRARHLRHVLGFAREADNQLQGKPAMNEWSERLKAELDNVRAALHWGMEKGDIHQTLALGSAMDRFWVMRGFSNEGRDWLKRLMEHPRAQSSTRERAYAVTSYCRSLRPTNDIALALPLMDEAMKIFTELNDESDIAHARFAQGDILLYAGHIEDAISILKQSLAYYREHPQQSFLHVNVLSSLGRAGLAQKDFTRAYEYIAESSAIAEVQGDLSTFAWNKLVLGDIAYSQDNLQLARENYETSLELYRPMNRVGNISYLLEALGSLAFWRGELDAAIELLEECFGQYKIANNSTGTAFSHGYRASIAQIQGDMETAAQWLQHAATPFSVIDDIYRSVYLVKLADYAAALGDSTSAVIHLLLALRFTSDPTTVLFPPDHRHAESKLESIRRSMSEAAFQSAEARAACISFEEAVRLVFPSL